MTDMADGSNKIGIDAVLDMTNFVAGIAQYNASIDQMNGLTQSATQVMGGISTMAVAAGTAIGNFFTQAVNEGVAALQNMVNSGIQAADKFQQLEFVDQALGQAYGVSTQAIQQQTQGMAQYGVTGTQAMKTLQQFIRYQLDMTDATKLANVAANASVITGQSVNDTLNQIANAIEYGRTTMLKYAGIVIDTTTAYKEYAAQLGINYKDLDAAQKQQALLNAVIQEGQRNNGMYQASMQSVAGELEHMQTVTMPGIEREMGMPFLNAQQAMVKGESDIADAFKKALDEGGALHPLLVDMGAVAQLVADQFERLAENASNWLDSMSQGKDVVIHITNDISINLTDLVNNFLTWGLNMGVNLANGLMQSAVYVLEALSWIADLITSLLQPGSPPKILPNIDKWGQETAQVYLEGWTKADFSTFDTLSQEIGNYIKSLDIPKEDVIPKTLGAHTAIAEAIDEVQRAGTVTQDAIDKITKAAGDGSVQMQNFIRLTMESAVADQQVTDAQNNLNEITSTYDAGLKALNNQLSAYNDTADQQKLVQLNAALATGRLTDAEKATVTSERNQILLKEQIQTVQDQRDADVAAAQAKLDAAKANQTTINDQLSVAKSQIDFTTQQNDLIKQQIALLEQMAKQKKSVAATGGSGEKLPSVQPIDFSKLEDQIQKEIEAAKEKIKAAIKAALDITPTSPFGKLQQSVDDLGKSFDDFKKNHLDPVLEVINDPSKLQDSKLVKDLSWLWTNLPVIGGSLIGFGVVLKSITGLLQIGEATGTLGAISGFLFGTPGGSVTIGTIIGATAATVGLAAGIGILVGEIIAFQPQLKAYWYDMETWWGTIVPHYLGVGYKAVTDWSANTLNNIGNWVTNAGNDISGWAIQADKDIDNWVNNEAQSFDQWVSDSSVKFGKWVSDRGTDITNWITNVPDHLKGALDDFQKWLSTNLTDALNKFTTTVLDPINTGFMNAKSWVDGLIKSVGDLGKLLPTITLPEWLVHHSPSPIEQSLYGMNYWMEALNQATIPDFKANLGSLSSLYNNMSSIQNITNFNSIDRRVTIGPISANYQQAQTVAGIYYDVSAALSMVRM